MRRAADGDGQHHRGSPGAAEDVGQRIRVDSCPAKARADEKNDRPLPVVIGQPIQNVVERPLRRQPEPRYHAGQATLGQDEAADDEQRGAKWATGTGERQHMAERDHRGAEQQQASQHGHREIM
jgi:hypothetical protein